MHMCVIIHMIYIIIGIISQLMKVISMVTSTRWLIPRIVLYVTQVTSGLSLLIPHKKQGI
jgi:NhaP-type Na+/H+ or K+/H+ antiporter